MKKLVLVLMLVGLFGFGCSQKAVVQSEAPMQKAGPTVVESKPIVVQKTAPQENVNEKELGELQRLKKELQAKLNDIHFNFDKAELESSAKPALNDLANILTK